MTIQDAITRADVFRPNKIPRGEKVRWLSELDGRIYNELLTTHEDCPVEAFDGYDESTSPTTVLLVGKPYEDVYIKWLAAQIDLANRELQNYNNSLSVFAAALEDFRNDWNRKHPGIRRGLRFFGRRRVRHEDPLHF